MRVTRHNRGRGGKHVERTPHRHSGTEGGVHGEVSNSTQESGLRFPSIRLGKRPFSITDFGQLEGEYDSQPTRRTPQRQSPHEYGQNRYNRAAYESQFPGNSSNTGVSAYSRNLSKHNEADRFEGVELDEDGYPIEDDRLIGTGLFNIPGGRKLDSRYCGGIENTNINQEPPLVDSNNVSNAYLEKRGLKRGKAAKICKRGYGANDPENISIVNMRESDGMSFEQIAKLLNLERIKNGKAPTLSTTGVTSRYNRTAPLLFAAQGEEFIPLSKRGRDRQGTTQRPTFQMHWTDELDEILVHSVQKWEQDKWKVAAATFNFHTGMELTPDAAATRYTLL
jgi:hypothetical protein